MSRPRRIAGAIESIRSRSQPATPLAAVQAAWREAAGERVAREAEPVRERAGEVTVACRAATWAQELDLLAPQLVERLNGALESSHVERLRFIVDPGALGDRL